MISFPTGAVSPSIFLKDSYALVRCLVAFLAAVSAATCSRWDLGRGALDWEEGAPAVARTVAEEGAAAGPDPPLAPGAPAEDGAAAVASPPPAGTAAAVAARRIPLA